MSSTKTSSEVKEETTSPGEDTASLPEQCKMMAEEGRERVVGGGEAVSSSKHTAEHPQEAGKDVRGWDAEAEAVSSDKHTAKQLRKAGKERRVVKRVLWLSVRHGSVLQKAHCQPSTKEVEVCGKKGATTCEKNAGERSKA
jgi:hypothetical protein